jgi:NTE family protein
VSYVDPDRDETQEWIDSLESVIATEGQPARRLPPRTHRRPRGAAWDQHLSAHNRLLQCHRSGSRTGLPWRRGDRSPHPPMTTAFVFSGGGSLGAVQAGMLLALAETGIYPDLVVGASVGAFNAAWVAGYPDAEGAEHLATIWRGVRRSDVFPTHLLTGFLGFVGKRDSLVLPDNLRRLVTTNLSYEKLEEAKLPVMVVAADITTGMEVVLKQGSALDALLASAAIPGVLPPVVIGPQTLVDGGVFNNAPISHAIEAGANKIYVLPTGYVCALYRSHREVLWRLRFSRSP